MDLDINYRQKSKTWNLVSACEELCYMVPFKACSTEECDKSTKNNNTKEQNEQMTLENLNENNKLVHLEIF